MLRSTCQEHATMQMSKVGLEIQVTDKHKVRFNFLKSIKRLKYVEK